MSSDEEIIRPRRSSTKGRVSYKEDDDDEDEDEEEKDSEVGSDESGTDGESEGSDGSDADDTADDESADDGESEEEEEDDDDYDEKPSKKKKPAASSSRKKVASAPKDADTVNLISGSDSEEDVPIVESAKKDEPKAKSPAKAKSPKKAASPMKAKALDVLDEEGPAGDVENGEKDLGVKSVKPKNLSSMPLEVSRGLAPSLLIENEDKDLDVSGDAGAVGRFKVNPEKPDTFMLDLKGQLYSGQIVPCATLMLVDVQADVAKVEAVMSECVQMKKLSNFMDAETIMEGTTTGFGFGVDDYDAGMSDDDDDGAGDNAKGKKGTKRKADTESAKGSKKPKKATKSKPKAKPKPKAKAKKK